MTKENTIFIAHPNPSILFKKFKKGKVVKIEYNLDFSDKLLKRINKNESLFPSGLVAIINENKKK